jgi:hypothetical protein
VRGFVLVTEYYYGMGDYRKHAIDVRKQPFADGCSIRFCLRLGMFQILFYTPHHQ